MSTTTVADDSNAVSSMRRHWALVSALLGGTTAMRLARERYLPKFPMETVEAYDARIAQAVLFPAFSRTVFTLSRKPFSKPLTVNDADTDMEAWLQDVDRQGRSLAPFAFEVFMATLGYGQSGILVEYPKAPPPGEDQPPRTQADEKLLGLRPYLVHIKPYQLRGWRASNVNGLWRLDQLRFAESVIEPDGPYGEVSIDQIRVIEPTRWETHRKNAKGEWVLYEEGVNTLGEVPFVPFYGETTGYLTSKPPLMEMAHLNVAHWQSDSDQRNILHIARVPILAAIGVEDDYALTVGAQAATKLPAGGDLKFVELQGKSIEEGAKDLVTLEERMRQAGAELLVLAPGKITASQVITENSVGMCALQGITEDFQDGLNRVLELMSKWAKKTQAPTCSMFKDFGATSLAEASAQLLLNMAGQGRLSNESLYEEFQRRGIVASDRSWDDERVRLEGEGPAGGSTGA